MLDKEFWNNLYETAQTGWDIGFPSTPLKTFIDNIENKDKSILIPGCGRAYEAEYLYMKGFKKVTIIDLSPLALDAFSKRLPSFPKSQLIEGDFFEHQGQYDLILEQTFFCALDPQLRPDYALKMKSLLKEGGILFGLLFNFPLSAEGPPFGGSEAEYLNLFRSHFQIQHLEICYNSIKPRAGREFFLELEA